MDKKVRKSPSTYERLIQEDAEFENDLEKNIAISFFQNFF